MRIVTRGCGRLALAALALLAGCDAPELSYNQTEVPEREARAQEAIDQAVAANGAATTARTGLPVSTPTPSAARNRAFPTEFRGYWGASAIDCELANTEARGRIDVDGDTIRFYGRRARVEELRELSPSEVIATLTYSGDRERVRRTDRFQLQAGGTALVRSEQPGGGVVRYQRC